MPGPAAQVIGDRVRRDAIDPWPEALAVAKPTEPAVQPDEHLLHDVVDIGGAVDAARHVGTQPRFELLPGTAGFRADHAGSPSQQLGAQHEPPPGFVPATMADAT